MTLKTITILSIILNGVLILLLVNSKALDFKNEVIESMDQTYNFASSTSKQSTIERWFHLQNELDNKVGMPILADQILNTLLEVDITIDSINSNIKNRKSVIKCQSIAEKINQSYDILKQQYHNTLDSLGEYGKMNKEEIQERVISFNKKLTPFKFKKCELNNNLSIIYLKNELFRLSTAKFFFIQKISNLIPIRTDLLYRTFPVVIPEKKKYKKGETFTSDIYIGNFAVNHHSESVLIINDKEFKFNKQKIKFSETVPNKIGVRKLDMTYNRINPFSKEIENATSMTYEYEIIN